VKKCWECNSSPNSTAYVSSNGCSPVLDIQVDLISVDKVVISATYKGVFEPST
jgi:hypothetical protein